MPTERSKLDRIWEWVFDLMDNDGYATGRIDYRSGGTGRLTANFDGVRYTVYVERAQLEP